MVFTGLSRSKGAMRIGALAVCEGLLSDFGCRSMVSASVLGLEIPVVVVEQIDSGRQFSTSLQPPYGKHLHPKPLIPHAEP